MLIKYTCVHDELDKNLNYLIEKKIETTGMNVNKYNNEKTK